MSQEITMQPKLYMGTDEARLDDEARAHAARLRSLQQSIARRPETFMRAFTELGEDATDGALDLHDERILTRDASTDPKDKIKEFFKKRDDGALQLDEESDEAIYSSAEFKRLSAVSKSKTSSSIKVGAQRTETRAHPEARKASDDVRRHIFGEYIGRAVLWKSQQEEEKKRHRSAS